MCQISTLGKVKSIIYKENQINQQKMITEFQQKIRLIRAMVCDISERHLVKEKMEDQDKRKRRWQDILGTTVWTNLINYLLDQ